MTPEDIAKDVKICMEPKIVTQILQKVLAGDRQGITINIFIVQNNDTQMVNNGNGGNGKQVQMLERVEGTSFGTGTEKYHITEELLRKALADNNWSKSATAHALQIPIYVIRSRCDRWGIRGPE